MARKIIRGMKEAVRHAKGGTAAKTTLVRRVWVVGNLYRLEHPILLKITDFRPSAEAFKRENQNLGLTLRPATLLIDMGKRKRKP